MADKQFYAGTLGPYIFDNSQQYPDGTYISGFYGPEARVTEAPVDPDHAANKQYVDDKVNYARLVDPEQLILIDNNPGIKHIWKIKVSPTGVLSTEDLGAAPGQ